MPMIGRRFVTQGCRRLLHDKGRDEGKFMEYHEWGRFDVDRDEGTKAHFFRQHIMYQSRRAFRAPYPECILLGLGAFQ